MEKKIETNKLLDFLREYISKLGSDYGCGEAPLFPDFEILPREYLEFANKELDINTIVSMINCIAHLKHAMNCQIDMFIYSFDL